MKTYALLAGLLVCTCAAGMAQTEQSSGTQEAQTSSPATGSAMRPRPSMSTATLERLWDSRAKMYQEAGVSQDRIEKLKEMEMKAFMAQQTGEKVDYAAMREERNKLITADEQKKLEKVRQERAQAMRNRLTAGETSSTAGEQKPAKTEKPTE